MIAGSQSESVKKRKEKRERKKKEKRKKKERNKEEIKRGRGETDEEIKFAKITVKFKRPAMIRYNTNNDCRTVSRPSK